MATAPLISDNTGVELMQTSGTLDENNLALLEVWLFHKSPPEALNIFVDSDYQLAFSSLGNRLGLVDYVNCPFEDGLYFEGDNNVSYVAKRSTEGSLMFHAKVSEASAKKIESMRKNFLDLVSTL